MTIGVGLVAGRTAGNSLTPGARDVVDWGVPFCVAETGARDVVDWGVPCCVAENGVVGEEGPKGVNGVRGVAGEAGAESYIVVDTMACRVADNNWSPWVGLGSNPK